MADPAEYPPLHDLMAKIGHEFGNARLLEEAMTHRSYSVERGLPFDNQRLEFLGDAVLQIIITEHLYARYPQEPEGRLTKMRSALAQQSTLAMLAGLLGLQAHVRVGRGERRANGHERISTLCDAFEALAGAIYLDGGLASASHCLSPLFEPICQAPEDLLPTLNPKGMLQEFVQEKWSTKPVYELTETTGPDHGRQFRVSVSVNGESLGEGVASSRKSAESMAAATALTHLRQRQPADAAVPPSS